MDSYRPWQISQSDCEISSNCGKKRTSTHVNKLDRRSLDSVITPSVQLVVPVSISHFTPWVKISLFRSLGLGQTNRSGISKQVSK